MKTRQSTKKGSLSCTFKGLIGNAKASQYEVLSDLKEVLGYKPDLSQQFKAPDTPHSMPKRRISNLAKQIKFSIDTEYDAILGLATLISDYEIREQVPTDSIDRRENRNYVEYQAQFVMNSDSDGVKCQTDCYGNRPYFLPMEFIMNSSVGKEEMHKYNTENTPCTYKISNANRYQHLHNHQMKRSAIHVTIAYYISGIQFIN